MFDRHDFDPRILSEHQRRVDGLPDPSHEPQGHAVAGASDSDFNDERLLTAARQEGLLERRICADRCRGLPPGHRELRLHQDEVVRVEHHAVRPLARGDLELV